MAHRNPAAVLSLILLLACNENCPAADHGDVAVLGQMMRSDAQITDLHAFTRNGNLVLSLCTNPAIPTTVDSYLFPSDLKLTFYIDRHSTVRFDDADDVQRFGGTIKVPVAVVPDRTITVSFDDEGAPQIKATGISKPYRDQMQVFAGLRDDPFIRRPREGRNVAAVVIELPLAAISRPDNVLLIWATTEIPGPVGATGDHGGLALRSMFDAPLNLLSPQMQAVTLGAQPDVIILDPSRPVAFPNGRALEDDVVDLVVPSVTLPGEGPTFPTTNDVPFLTEFPYLAPPQ